MQPARPNSIRVLGTLNLVFAALGALGLVMTWAMYFGGMKFGPRNPVIELAKEQPDYMSYLRWSFLIGGVRCALMGAAGLGLVRFRAWARKVSIACALYSIISGIAAAWATYHYLIEPLARKHDPASTGGAYGGAIGIVISFVYPVILLVFMLKKDVRDALERASDPPIPSARQL